jgi:hypothetical protein
MIIKTPEIIVIERKIRRVFEHRTGDNSKISALQNTPDLRLAS